jgi:hypothetical protein
MYKYTSTSQIERQLKHDENIEQQTNQINDIDEHSLNDFYTMMFPQPYDIFSKQATKNMK